MKIEVPRFNNSRYPESQLYDVVQGETALFTNFVAIKEKALSSYFVENG